MEEAEKEKNTETREEKEGGGADKGRKREEKQEAGENIHQWEMGYIRLKKLKLKETQENLVWLKLVKEGTRVKRGKEVGRSSQAALEDGRSRTETKRGLTESTSQAKMTKMRVRPDVPVPLG